MAAKKVSQGEMRQMMQKLKSEKGDSQDRKRKYKLSAREEALLEMEKKRKLEEKIVKQKTVAKKAGVPDNFFDSAKTKAFLNLGKAPQKSILKNSSKTTSASEDQSSKTPAANSKAKGTEWTSSAPVLTKTAGPQPPSKEKSPQAKKLLRTPSGGTINHLEEDLGPVIEAPPTSSDKGGDLPEGFFDDPVMDAKVRGVEYKVYSKAKR